MQKDAESRCTPETYTCNGSASRKTCKHQSKRDRLERERELLRRQEDTPNQEEEGQDSGTEGEDTKTDTETQEPARPAGRLSVESLCPRGFHLGATTTCRLIGESKLPVGVNVSMNADLCQLESPPATHDPAKDMWS